MATTTIQEIYNKAPAASAGDDDILLIAQNEATKGVKLKDATAGKAKKATDAEYAAHLGVAGVPLSVGTEKTPVYINKNGIPKVCSAVAAATADAATYAQKIGTPQAHPAIGNTSTPIFINSDGIATACSEIHATIANAGSTGIPVYTQGNAVRECANFGICTTDTNVMAKEVQINGFVKKAGAHIYVKFTNDGGGVRGTYDLTLNVHNGNANTGAAPVYVGKYQCGIGAINAGCVYEMLYDGEHYIILNSDIVAQETAESASYIKHGNGLIKQWGKVEKGSDMTPQMDWKFRIDGLLFKNDYSLFFNIETLVATGGPEYTYKRDGGSCKCNLTNRNMGVKIDKADCSMVCYRFLAYIKRFYEK